MFIKTNLYHFRIVCDHTKLGVLRFVFRIHCLVRQLFYVLTPEVWASDVLGETSKNWTVFKLNEKSSKY